MHSFIHILDAIAALVLIACMVMVWRSYRKWDFARDSSVQVPGKLIRMILRNQIFVMAYALFWVILATFRLH